MPVIQASAEHPAGWVLQSSWIEAEDPLHLGHLELELSHSAGVTVPEGLRLCFTCQLSATPPEGVQGAIEQVWDGTYHEMGLDKRADASGQTCWRFAMHGLNFKPMHANDGPVSAYVILEEGQVERVSVTPMVPVYRERRPATAAAPEPAESSSAPLLSVVPYPNSVSGPLQGGTLPQWLVLPEDAEAELVSQAEVAEAVRAELFPDEAPVFDSASGGLPVEWQRHDSTAESYRIEFEPTRVLIHSHDAAGLFYACITLCHIVRSARLDPERFSYPCTGTTISDAPRFAWRGTHLDVARQFFPAQDIKRLMAILAWFKLNRFHWHLSDDEAWRVQINAYPSLTDIGARRGYGQAIPPQYADGAQGCSGFYTQQDIREVVSLASARHIVVIPEIDMPGHSTAALRSLPALCDPQEPPGSYFSVQGFHNNALNPALPDTRLFAHRVIDELVQLFPGEVFHMGGDEVAEGAWQKSPAAQEYAKRLGLDSVQRLKDHFLADIQQHLISHGKVMGVWDDGVSDLLQADQVRAFVWRDTDQAHSLARAGLDIVMTPAQSYYLDIAQSSRWEAPGASWTGQPNDLYTVYHYEVPDTEALEQHVVGVQSGIWSEHLAERAIFNDLVFPRILGVAESGWTLPQNKLWSRFNALCSADQGAPNTVTL